MKRGNLFKRLLCAILVVAMLSSFAVPAYAEDNVKVTFEQVDNSAVTATIPGRDSVNLPDANSDYADNDMVRVSIVLEKAGTIEAGYSPMGIASNKAAMTYRSSVERNQTSVTTKIERAIKSDLDIVWNLTLAANIISANVPYGKIEAIEKVAGVAEVLIETRYEPDVANTGAADPNMATSGKQIGSAAAWASGYTGAGSRIAIIDTGTDTDHQSFNVTAYNYSLGVLAGKAGVDPDAYVESLDLLDAAEIDAVAQYLNAPATGDSAYINSKLPFGYNYIDKNFNVTHDNDSQGSHGSHVAGIATANAYIANSDGTFTNSMANYFVQGVAPDAQLITMKVFGKAGGAYDSDYMAAIEDAIVLGCDSVNLSLGSGNPGTSRNSNAKYQAILDSLVNSGVMVVMSAGNSGYWVENAENMVPYQYIEDTSFQTDGSPGSFTNSLAVASVDNDGTTGLYVQVDDVMVVYNETDYSNKPFTTIAGEHEYIFIDGFGSPEEWAVAGDALAGKIALCSRGTLSFFEKALNAVDAGAIATFIYDNQPGIINMDLTDYPYTQPVASMTQADGMAIKAVSTPVTDEAGNILYYTGTMIVGEGRTAAQFNSEYYTMSSFSSWGVPGSLELKPEITAPGGSIYSINGVDASGTAYEVMSGTSMAAPQVTGMAALVAQYIREAGLDEKTGLDERTLGQSLLMSTAVPVRDGSTGNYYPVIQQGAGLANIGAAVTADSYIMMGEDATASYADGKVKAELGDDPDREGVYSFSFTINNLTDEDKTYALSSDMFTQDVFANYDAIGNVQLYMDTWTATLGHLATWTVDGQTVDGGEDLIGLDFNGDGAVDIEDGQALLDYATGVRTELSNIELADLNADGKINSYDSYIFFTMYNAGGAKVPANGSVEVTVTLTLLEDEKAFLDTYYTSGAYIEAYIFAESLSTAEGVEGTTHSIPVLGFYGNWTEASMFDQGTTISAYVDGSLAKLPYLYSSNYINYNSNGLYVTYADDPSMYVFGGNPMVADNTYYPERDAVNSAASLTVGFAAIRNAAESKYFISDAATGTVFAEQNLGEVSSAYYYVNGAVWNNTFYSLDLGNLPAALNDMTVNVGLTLAPEYYVDGENVAWDALGAGATFMQTVTVDNDAPVLEDVSVSLMNNTLTVAASDNQYVAAIALYDIYGQYLYTYVGSAAEAEAGQSLEYVIDLAEVNGPSFLLQVTDYAMNTTTYEIEMQIGEVVDEIESIEISKTAMTMAAGSSDTLTAVVYPVNASDRSVIWTSSDESVATVEDGVVYAVSDGTAIITAASAMDPTITATCTVTVITVDVTIEGVLQDAEGNPMTYTWDLANDTTWTPGVAIPTDVSSAAKDAYADILYVQNTASVMHMLDATTGESLGSSGACAFGAAVNDLTALQVFGTADGDSLLMGVYGGYLLGPNTAMENTFSSGWNLASLMGMYTGGTKFVAVTSAGAAYNGKGNLCDFIMALDDTGSIWVFWYDGTGSISFNYFSTDLDVTWPTYSGSQYCSMVADPATSDVVVSRFTGTTNEIYYLTFNGSGFNSLKIGDVGADVWPASVTAMSFNEAAEADAQNVLATDAVIANAITVGEELYVTDIAAEVESKAGGSLNSVANYVAPIRPMSAGDVGEGENEVTVTVTAKDVTGNDVTSYNGVSVVDYDAEALVLTGIEVAGDYTSVLKETGSVTFGYVALDGIAAGDTVATLYFDVLDTDVTSVTVTSKETNNDEPDFEELVDIVFPHYNTEIRDAKEATCTEEGYTGDVYCTDCGKLVQQGEVIPAKGHEYEAVVTEPTCTEAGYTTYTCSVCGDSYIDDIVNPTGHTYGEAVFVWAEDYSACIVTYSCACGHSETFSAVVTSETTEATCTEEGLIVYTATFNEDSESVEVIIPAKGHDYVAVVTAPTCTEQGYTTYTCSACGDSYVDDYVEATGHSWAAPEFTWNDDKTACTVTFTCSVCGETQTFDAEVTVETTEPTCEEAGKTVYTATYGNYSSSIEVEIPANGHAWADPEFTWNEDKSECTVIYTCACGDTETIAATVTSETIDATCEEAGKIIYTATCGEDVNVVEVEIPATGHAWGEWVVTKEATTKAEGEETRTCANCGATETRSIERLPSENDSADTGDAFSGLWMFLMALTLAGASVLVVNRKRFMK